MKILKMLSGLAVAALITVATATSGAAAGTAPTGDPLSVLLVAQSPIQPSTHCTFTAYASGGTGNYTYYWTTTPNRLISFYLNEITVSSSTSFTVSVTVNDGSTTASDNASITISSNAAACPY
jgi:hypothetical protein